MRSVAILALALGGMLLTGPAFAADPARPQASNASQKGKRAVYVRIQKGTSVEFVRVEFDLPESATKLSRGGATRTAGAFTRK